MYKWIKFSLLTLVGCGFLALAVYAFIKREEIKAAQIEPPTIQAPTQPLKTRPESPGGLQFPNQDKLVFDLLENTGPAASSMVAGTAASADALLAPTPTAGTPTAVTEPLSQAAAASSFAPLTNPNTNPNANPDASPTGGGGKTELVTPPAIAKIAEIKPATKPEPKAEAKATPKPEPKPEPKATAKPVAATTTAKGPWAVQLAAVGSMADGQTVAKQLQSKLSALKGLAIRIAPAPGGARFRVQFAGLANRAAAQAVCDKLGSQPCFPVGK